MTVNKSTNPHRFAAATLLVAEPPCIGKDPITGGDRLW